MSRSRETQNDDEKAVCARDKTHDQRRRDPRSFVGLDKVLNLSWIKKSNFSQLYAQTLKMA